MLKIKKEISIFFDSYSPNGFVDPGDTTLSDVYDSYSDGTLSADQAESLLDSYGIPHTEIGSIEYDSKNNRYVVRNPDNSYYFIEVSDYGYIEDPNAPDGRIPLYRAEITYGPPQGGYTTYYVYDDSTDEYGTDVYIEAVGVNGTTIYQTYVDNNGKRHLEYSEEKGYIYECYENDDGTVTVKVQLWNPFTEEYEEVMTNTYDESIDSAQQLATDAALAAQEAQADYRNQSLYGVFGEFDLTRGGPSFESYVDGMFYDTPRMAEVFLDTKNIISATNSLHDRTRAYFSTVDGSDITGYDSLLSSLNNSLSCSSCNLNYGGQQNCLEASLDDFFENMKKALDLAYIMEHSNISSFDENSVNIDDITVEFINRKGEKYTSYSEYLLNNSQKRIENGIGAGLDNSTKEYVFYEDGRDLTPYYAKTVTQGLVGGLEATNTNVVKNNYFKGDWDVSGSASISLDDIGELMMGMGSDSGPDLGFEAKLYGDYVYYSNSTDFVIMNRDGTINEHTNSSIDVGKLHGEGSISYSTGDRNDTTGYNGLKIGAGFSFTGINFKTSRYNSAIPKLNYALDVSLIELGIEGSLTLGPDFADRLMNNKELHKIRSGKYGANAKSLEDIGLSSEIGFAFEGKFYYNLAHVKYKTVLDVFGTETVASFDVKLGGEFSLTNPPKKFGLYAKWPEFEFGLSPKDMYEEFMEVKKSREQDNSKTSTANLGTRIEDGVTKEEWIENRIIQIMNENNWSGPEAEARARQIAENEYNGNNSGQIVAGAIMDATNIMLETAARVEEKVKENV